MAICIYPQDCADFSTNGLGALTPLSCTVREESCGMFDLELEQPIDATLRWAQLAVGCILKAPVPARESPLYEIEAFEGSEQATTTVTRQLYRVKTNGGRLHLRQQPSTSAPILAKYHQGTEVVKMNDAGGGWFEVVVRDGGARGYMYSHWLEYVRDFTETVTTTLPVTREGITVRQSRDQLFRIYSVERDAREQVVRVKALHISYDLRANLVNGAYEVQKKTTAKDVLAAIFSKLAVKTVFELHAAPALTMKITGDYGWKNPIECLLDPDEGVLKQAGALLVRDNFDLYAIPDEPRDSGVTIRRGKNLAGVIVTEDASAVVTRIIPCGKRRSGKDLLLPDTPWVDSPHIGDYPTPFVKKIDYDVRVVEKDADGETTFLDATKACEKLRALAEADFAENGVDLPSLGMDVDFVLLQNAAEYADYAALQAVYLNDTVTVIDGVIGLKAKLRVTGYEWNALTRQYERVSLGDVESMEQTVYSYNLPSGGISGTKLAAGSVSGVALRDATIEYAKIAVATIDQLTADSIVALTARIREIVANKLTTDELYAALAKLNTAVIENADIQWANIQSLQAAVAEIASANIGTADIGWAQIKDLITGTAIITEGVGGQLFISRLAVTEANMVSLTTGELVVKGKDGHFYAVTVDEAGNVKTELKQVNNDDVYDLSINAGEKLIEGSVTAGCLNATDIFADNAVIRQMIAANLDVDTLFAREAFVALLRTSRIVGENTLEIVVENAESASKDAAAAKDAVDNLQVGGRNLIRGTRAMDRYYHSSIVTFSTDAEGFAVASWAKASSAAWTYLSNSLPLTPLSVVRNKTITVSFDVRTSDPDAYNADSTHGLAVVFNTSDPTTAAQRKYRAVVLYNEPLSTQWRRIAVTRELTDDFFSSGSGTIDEATAFQIAIDNYSVYPMDVRKIKVELGNKATDWTPAPEDVEAQIEDTADSLSRQIGDVNNRVNDRVTHAEQEAYLRLVSGQADDNGVYVGYKDAPAQAFIDAEGWFKVLYNGVSISSLGPRIQELGSLTIYETADGGHAFI